MKARFIYAGVALIGMIGLSFVTVWTVKGESNSLMWIAALLSMFVMLIGANCYRETGGRP